VALDGRFQEVMGAAQDGAEWALSCLYREIHPPLLGWLRARDSMEAEDLASETWMAVTRGLHRFQGDEAGFRGWVFTIARRRIVDLRRHQARRPVTTPLDDHEPRATAEPADGEVIRSAATTEALSRIATLPEPQAEIVLLRVVAGLTADQVGKVVGKRPGTVRVLQHRALRRLAAQLTADPLGVGEDNEINEVNDSNDADDISDANEANKVGIEAASP
jgi:RNA polymerase sigma-70 factor (ECF subfamily)